MFPVSSAGVLAFFIMLRTDVRYRTLEPFQFLQLFDLYECWLVIPKGKSCSFDLLWGILSIFCAFAVVSAFFSTLWVSLCTFVASARLPKPSASYTLCFAPPTPRYVVLISSPLLIPSASVLFGMLSTSTCGWQWLHQHQQHQDDDHDGPTTPARWRSTDIERGKDKWVVGKTLSF